MHIHTYNTHISRLTYMYTCKKTHKRICTHAHTHTRTHTDTQTHTHTHKHKHMHVRTHIHTHKHTHTHTHTFIIKLYISELWESIVIISVLINHLVTKHHCKHLLV